MKKLSSAIIVLVTVCFAMGVATAFAQSSVQDWGSIGRHGWPMVPSTVPGSAEMGSTTYPQGAWATLRGGFSTITAAESQAVVATGKLEFLGGDPTSWSALRFGIFQHDSSGTLLYAGTDSARWSGKESLAHGYMFSPHSGVNDQVSGQGGNGTQWAVGGGSWLSTWSGGTMTMGVINQAPNRAELKAGVYNWAISLRPLGDGTNEVKWYLVKEDNSYWFGGSVIDTLGVTTSVNGIVFGVNSGNGIDATGVTGLKIMDAQIGLGDPVVVPTAPFDDFFVGQWGSIGRHGWPIIPDPDGFVGNCGMGSTTYPQGAWATLRGEFDIPVTATEEKALVATGKLEFMGGDPTSWSALRFGIFRHDSAGTLLYAGTDSARWSGKENLAHGYMFSPRSGVNDQVSGQGGNGTQWVVNGGGWLSTWSGGTKTMGVINQAPTRAQKTAGVYNWAFSIRPLADGNNEVKWYLIKEDNSYWFGGTAIDTMGIGSTFNGIIFGVNNGNGIDATSVTGLQIYDAHVDLAEPITVPEAPWQAYYVTQWGILGASHGWKLVPGEFDGDAGMGGAALPTAWEGLYGQFPEPVTATKDKAVIIKGEIEFLGAGPTTWSPFRYAVFYNDSAKTLVNAGTDSAVFKGGKANPVYGYSMMPRSGITDQISGQGGLGNLWSVKGGGYNSTWSGGNRTMGVFNNAPARAEMTAGVYEWAISVQVVNDTTNEVRWYLQKKLAPGETQTSYFIGGKALDPRGASAKFNAVAFAINNNVPEGMTGINVYAVQVDKGDPITVPEAPWQAYYVTQWGILGASHGWKLVPGEFDGDAGMGGASRPTTWEGLYGQFLEPVTATTDKAVIVKGEIEFLGAGPTTWSPFRYAVFYNDSAKTLVNAGTDSAVFKGGKANPVYGYSVTPRSGITDQISGQGGLGNLWSVKGGGYNSTWSGGNRTMGVFSNAPARAEMTAGVYEWAFSIHVVSDSTTEVRWYMQKKLAPGETQTSYFIGGTAQDPRGASAKFNAVAFAINNNVPEEMTGINVYAVQVDKGDPITVPEAPWQAYYVTQWGFYGNKIGGWKYTPGEFDGDATISGSAPNSGWSVLRGGFVEPVKPKVEKAISVTGQLEFVQGGFEAWSSLRFGLCYSDSAGKVDTTGVDSTHWTGTDAHDYGYLFIPPSGSNGPTTWQGISATGTYGAIVDNPWLSPNGASAYVLGSNLQTPNLAVGGAGVYDFAISVQPLGDGTSEIRVKLIKSDKSYQWAAKTIDTHNPLATEKFNSILFALNTNATTKGMNVLAVQVDLGAPVELPDWVVSVEAPKTKVIPIQFALDQNYPNPFNPTTTITFALPNSSNVKLVVYDAVGRMVAELVSGKLEAGYHTINFNASSLASGVYFYKLTAGEFSSIKKLMLLK